MATKVEAQISEFLNYTTENYSVFNIIGGNLANLENWNIPLYDAKPSYTLSFKAPKTSDTLAGIFTINHKVTGDYTNPDSADSSQNGTFSDVITASYGVIDKFKLTNSQTVSTKMDKNGDLSSRNKTLTYSETVTNSNGTLDDKSDDLSWTKSSKSSEIYVPTSETTTTTTTSSETYKSNILNFSNSSKYTGTSESVYSSSESGKASYNNTDSDSGTSISANIVYDENAKRTEDSNSSTLNFSSATFKIVSPDIKSSLSFSGKVQNTDGVINLSLKNFTLENSDLKWVSGSVSAIIDEANYNVFNGAKNILENDSVDGGAIDDLINSLPDVFKSFNQGDNTITIKNTNGYSVDAGDGKDTVIGGEGDDNITGGDGFDNLTGGKGADTFNFSFMDFQYDENSAKNIPDVITDFSLSDRDVLNFGDMYELQFYANLQAAKDAKADLFYVKDSGSIYLNTDTTQTKYIPTLIITLTGKPAVNADLTDWNYPA